MSQSPQGGIQMKAAEQELHAEPTITDGLLVYGVFPKSECKDRDIISKAVLAKADKRGYSFIDGKWYCSYMGRVFLVEPLSWHIMSRKGDVVRAFCESLPFARNYSEKACKYKASGVRKYLQNDFALMAFGKDRAVKSIELMSVEEFSKIPDKSPIFPTHFTDFAFAAGAQMPHEGTIHSSNTWHAIQWWLACDVNQDYIYFAKQYNWEAPGNPVSVAKDSHKGYQGCIYGVRPIIEIKMK